ncbi:unnamed protein product [Lactuca virosa]|uniref:DUF659 domain-containing protein n=1 Tax=Lactuca virosa TaxID=75947 RepID=A0AAU9PWH8_9ASTR|nr:unnamed protein product [Lactuca virosa]
MDDNVVQTNGPENVVDVNAQTQENVEDKDESSDRKRKLTSDVWLEFERIKNKDGSQSAKCNHCKTLFRQIIDCILDWKLDEKLFSMVLDNASVNDAMVRTLKSWLCDRSAIPLNGKLFHVCCSAHILKLVVQDGLKVIGEFIHKVKETIKYLKRSPYATQNFNSMKVHHKIKDKKKVQMDWPTRWNSTFLMIKSVLEMKGVFWRLAQTYVIINSIQLTRRGKLHK